jgi:hypothetical protein
VGATSYFGYRCPKCGAKVAMGIGEPSCPACGTRMVPDHQATGAAANVYCAKCKAAYGLTLSTTCPQCGGPLGRMPSR